MNAKLLICVLTAAWLLTPPAVDIVSTQAGQHASHGSTSTGNTRGPLAAAVRHATERYRDVNEALAVGYVQFGGCVSGPEEGAMGVHFVELRALRRSSSRSKHPEVLVYEPRERSTPPRCGRIRHTGGCVAWPVMTMSTLPHLMGHLFHFAPGPNRYGPAGVLRAARLGLEEQPAWDIRRLEPERVVCGLGRNVLTRP